MFYEFDDDSYQAAQSHRIDAENALIRIVEDIESVLDKQDTTRFPVNLLRNYAGKLKDAAAAEAKATCAVMLYGRHNPEYRVELEQAVGIRDKDGRVVRSRL